MTHAVLVHAALIASSSRPIWRTDASVPPMFADAAKRTARDEAGTALLVNATPMAHLRAVSEAGGLMPQKSTYFYPKLATGLTINRLA